MDPVGIESLDGLLARYATGLLPEPARVLVAAHLAMKPERKPLVRAFEAAAADAMEQIEPVALSQRQACLDRIFNAAPLPTKNPPAAAGGLFPVILRDFVGHDAADIPWKTKMPGFREFHLGETDGCEAKLFWIKAGRRIPSHTHEGSEITLVLDGSFSDASGHFGPGDIAVADEHVDHHPVAGIERACICFAVTDAPLRLTGSFGQFFSDFIGR